MKITGLNLKSIHRWQYNFLTIFFNFVQKLSKPTTSFKIFIYFFLSCPSEFNEDKALIIISHQLRK